MSACRYVEALLWMDRESPIDDAEFVVRLARPSRWPVARFGPDDVDRAARAIRHDPGYLRDVSLDAEATARRAGVGVLRLRRAVASVKAAWPLPVVAQ